MIFIHSEAKNVHFYKENGLFISFKRYFLLTSTLHNSPLSKGWKSIPSILAQNGGKFFITDFVIVHEVWFQKISVT